jgi:hypothetical protein
MTLASFLGRPSGDLNAYAKRSVSSCDFVSPNRWRTIARLISRKQLDEYLFPQRSLINGFHTSACVAPQSELSIISGSGSGITLQSFCKCSLVILNSLNNFGKSADLF